MKRISYILIAVLLALLPVVLSAAPPLPFDGVTSQSRDFGNQPGRQVFFAGTASTGGTTTIINDEWKWYGSYLDPDSVMRNSFDWPSGTNGDNFYNADYVLIDLVTGNYKDITDWDASSGTFTTATFNPAIATGGGIAVAHNSIVDAISAGDSIRYINKLLWGAAGFPALTGVKFVAAGGISLGEGLVDLADRVADIDSTSNNERAAVVAVRAEVDTLFAVRSYRASYTGAIPSGASDTLFAFKGLWSIEYLVATPTVALDNSAANGKFILVMNATSTDLCSAVDLSPGGAGIGISGFIQCPLDSAGALQASQPDLPFHPQRGTMGVPVAGELNVNGLILNSSSTGGGNSTQGEARILFNTSGATTGTVKYTVRAMPLERGGICQIRIKGATSYTTVQ